MENSQLILLFLAVLLGHQGVDWELLEAVREWSEEELPVYINPN